MIFHYKKSLRSLIVIALTITTFFSTFANATLFDVTEPMISTDGSIIIVEKEIMTELAPLELYYDVYNFNQDSIWFFAVSTNTNGAEPFSYRSGWANTALLTSNEWAITLTDINDNLGTNLGGSFSSYFGTDSFATLYYIDFSMEGEANPIFNSSVSEFGLHYALMTSQFVAFNVNGNFIAQSLPVPEPSTLAIFGLALIGLFGKKLKNNKIS